MDGTLPIPPLLAPETQAGASVFRLTMQQGTREFVTGKPTSTFGFNGDYLGPTLRATVGDDLRRAGQAPVLERGLGDDRPAARDRDIGRAGTYDERRERSERRRDRSSASGCQAQAAGETST